MSNHINTDNINDLVNCLKKASDLYYNTGESFLSDKEYDELENILRSKDPTNPFLLGVGSEVRGKKVELPFVMPGLNLISPEDVNKWIVDNNLTNEEIVISNKLDGTSVMIVYDHNGELQIAYSRGNGTLGQDITRHIKKIKSIPKKIDRQLTIRGEVVFNEGLFNELKPKLEEQLNSSIKNSRNFVAGQTNAKESISLFYNNVDVVAYEIVWPYMDKKEQMETLFTFFNTATYTLNKGSEITELYLKDYLTNQLNSSKYLLDGVVLDVSNINTRKRLTSKKTSSNLNPEYAKKFKLVGENNIATTVVKEVLWKTSKSGFLKPTISFEPVNLMGATISRATGFNAKFIVDNNIGPNAIIEICRSGDVIPFVRKVIQPSQAQFPNNNVEEYIWSENKVDFILKEKNEEVEIQQFISSTRILQIEHFAGQTIKKLFANNIKNIKDLIINSNNLELVGKIIGSNIMAEKGLQSLKFRLNNVPLEVLAAASNCYGRGIGIKKISKIVQKYDTVFNLTFEQICDVDGFEATTAELIIQGEQEFKKFLKEIDGFYTLKSNLKENYQNNINTNGIYSNCVFVFTGFRSEELKNKIQQAGGVISDGITKQTTHLVTKDPTKVSSKIKKAREDNIEIISLQDIEGLLK